ncbi:SulP family inorganic anion transporter [Bilophila wadsworthia]|uniref:SulP family inorganic anion transporter n=1 Tax=Bilophila wadsworthia TaxID=35833 RepID=UPI0024320110|nr:sulfate permease [Bilophila wadsworthia]
MSSTAPQARYKTPLIPSLFKTIRSGYTPDLFSRDLSAGITVGIVAIPLALAFAIASGLTPERGLYTSIVAGFFMAFFSGSRFPVSGPTGAFVVIIYSIVSRHGYEGLVLTTLMAGILLVIFGFLRLGALVKYIPYPVTTGFTTGIALLIFSSQIKDFFGLPLVDTPPEFFDKWGAYAQNAMDFSPSTLGVAAFTLLVILIVRRKIPKLPAPVVAVFLSTLLVWLFSLPTDTIGSRFGTLPTGFPDFALPQGVTFERIRELFPDALTIALLAGIESLLACVVADSMTGDRHNSNMELISQGIGNVASVFFGGFAATGAIARTATNIRAGAMSSISAIVHSLFLVAVVMWLLPLIELIPLAALASVLVIVAYDMSDLRTVRHIFQGPKSDWSVMLLTFALTVVFDLTVAVYTGVILASLLFMRRMGELTGLHTCVSSEDEASGHEIPVPDKNNVPDGVEIFAINGPLFFGVADRFQSTLNAMETPPKVFIMYLHNMSAIDMTGIHALEEFLERRRKGCRVLFAAVRKPVHRTLQRVGILRTVGEKNVFPSLDEALLRAEEILEDTIPGERVLPRLVSKS